MEMFRALFSIPETLVDPPARPLADACLLFEVFSCHHTLAWISLFLCFSRSL